MYTFSSELARTVDDLDKQCGDGYMFRGDGHRPRCVVNKDEDTGRERKRVLHLLHESTKVGKQLRDEVQKQKARKVFTTTINERFQWVKRAVGKVFRWAKDNAWNMIMIVLNYMLKNLWKLAVMYVVMTVLPGLVGSFLVAQGPVGQSVVSGCRIINAIVTCLSHASFCAAILSMLPVLAKMCPMVDEVLTKSKSLLIGAMTKLLSKRGPDDKTIDAVAASHIQARVAVARVPNAKYSGQKNEAELLTLQQATKSMLLTQEAKKEIVDNVKKQLQDERGEFTPTGELALSIVDNGLFLGLLRSSTLWVS
ncbi:hypothetical protein JKP88DRAFT_248319 [Tribonema minus]|uniref:Uncharacterized protein n=1 Tax=Tribonema minus TaxID=303371 RepID=A0A835YNQ8_9STRA|nr:hypothetical protein JKP88DRAFT_248319 [Tribonema minus]